MRTNELFATAIILAAAACGGQRTTGAQQSEDPSGQTFAQGEAAPATGVSPEMKSEAGPGAAAGTMPGEQQPETMPVAGLDDQQFVRMAASSGKFEVQSSQYVMDQNVKMVQPIAQEMVRDHTKANQQLTSLAQQIDLQVPDELLPKHQQLMQQIETAPAEQVATVYLNIQRQSHQEAIQLFERCVEECQDQQLRSFASETLPTLRKHLGDVHQHGTSGSR